MIVREPKYSGKFYPEKPRVLISMLQDLYNRVEFSRKKIRSNGILLPHAAYHYSGHVAMSVLKCIEIPENIIIFCPNHNGLGEDVNIVSEGRFITPIGDVAINSDIARGIMKDIPEVKEDIKSHLIEHSIEVQLPLLKYLRNDVRIVPILIKKLKANILTKLISDFANFFKGSGASDIL
ncbi:MAG: AmmeMemoRadiSam system protein B, partial [Myxococcota bacterium]